MRVRVAITVNGKEELADVQPRLFLVDYLRDVLGLRATNVGCDTSSCGSCTVLVDGESVKSCTMLAVQADGHEVLTLEGLADASGEGDSRSGGWHPMQQAFRTHHGLQCGFCTPGMVLAAISLVLEKHEHNPVGARLTEDQVRQGLKGNLCRCTGYHNIVQAVLAASEAVTQVHIASRRR